MLDLGGSEGGNPQMVKAMQAQKAAQSAQSLSDLGASHTSGVSSGGDSASSSSGSLTPQHGQSGMTGLPQGAAATHSPTPQPPREVGSIPEELIQRPLNDLGQEVKSWFDINKWFGINTEDTPEAKQRKTELHQRYQQLNQEQQQYFQARLKREMERKNQMAQDQQLRDQQKAAAEQNGLPEPSSPQKGPGSEGKKKSQSQRMTNVVNQNRQSFNKMQSSG